jgi:hypothetical protein
MLFQAMARNIYSIQSAVHSLHACDGRSHIERPSRPSIHLGVIIYLMPPSFFLSALRLGISHLFASKILWDSIVDTYLIIKHKEGLIHPRTYTSAPGLAGGRIHNERTLTSPQNLVAARFSVLVPIGLSGPSRPSGPSWQTD